VIARGDRQQRGREVPREVLRRHVRAGGLAGPPGGDLVDAVEHEKAGDDGEKVDRQRRNPGLDEGRDGGLPGGRGDQAVVGRHPQEGDDEGSRAGFLAEPVVGQPGRRQGERDPVGGALERRDPPVGAQRSRDRIDAVEPGVGAVQRDPRQGHDGVPEDDAGQQPRRLCDRAHDLDPDQREQAGDARPRAQALGVVPVAQAGDGGREPPPGVEGGPGVSYQVHRHDIARPPPRPHHHDGEALRGRKQRGRGPVRPEKAAGEDECQRHDSNPADPPGQRRANRPWHPGVEVPGVHDPDRLVVRQETREEKGSADDDPAGADGEPGRDVPARGAAQPADVCECWLGEQDGGEERGPDTCR